MECVCQAWPPRNYALRPSKEHASIAPCLHLQLSGRIDPMLLQYHPCHLMRLPTSTDFQDLVPSLLYMEKTEFPVCLWAIHEVKSQFFAESSGGEKRRSLPYIKTDCLKFMLFLSSNC